MSTKFRPSEQKLDSVLGNMSPFNQDRDKLRKSLTKQALQQELNHLRDWSDNQQGLFDLLEGIIREL